MLLLLTIGLVLVGAVSLVIGFVSQNTLPIYISIACSVAAGLVLLVFSRMNRRQAVVPATAAADDGTGPATTEFVLQEARSAARPTAAAAIDDGFPIEDYDQLLVSEIVPLLPELDLEELDAVRAREEDSKARASILRRIDALAEELEGTGPAAEAEDVEEEEEEEEEEYVDVETGSDDELFPIADYDELRVNQILPLLPELDDDELVLVADRERGGAGRYSILVRIDELLGVTVAPAPKKAAARKTAAKKTAAKKAPAKKAPAKKAPAKTAPAKRAAAPRRAAGAQKTQKAAAKKTTAKKAPAKKAAAKKR